MYTPHTGSVFIIFISYLNLLEYHDHRLMLSLILFISFMRVSIALSNFRSSLLCSSVIMSCNLNLVYAISHNMTNKIMIKYIIERSSIIISSLYLTITQSLDNMSTCDAVHPTVIEPSAVFMSI